MALLRLVVPQRREAARLRAGTPDASRPSAGRRFAAYLRDVRAELAKVLWPKRADVVNYSTVVLSTLVLMAALIFALNYVFAKGVMFLFKS